MLFFLLYLIPIILLGIIILQKICKIDRLELLIPAGSILGISLFVFFINILAFFAPGTYGINLTYFSLVVLLLLTLRRLKWTSEINLPKGRMFFFWLLSTSAWAWLIFWKGKFALIGSDTNLYYSIAHTFIKGNFPPQTPWQPDLPLTYHLGAFELLGAFNHFTNLSFEFLHIFFSCFFIFCSSQIIVWIWKRHDSVGSFLWGNLAAAISLVSFGFLKLAIPTFPLKFPEIQNLHQLFLWVRNLPIVNQSIEAYGAPVNLDTLIYFIFHSFGLAIVLSLVVLIVYSRKSNVFHKWIIFMIGLSTLALINESIFVLSAPALITGGFFKELQNEFFLRSKTLPMNIKLISVLLVIMCVLVVVQGGTITNSILAANTVEKSILIFPSEKDITGDFISYHHNQTISRSLPIRKEWLPLKWFHLGNDILILLCVISIIFIKFSKDQKIVLIILFITGISSLLAYNFIVPKYLVANGNRFLVFAFISFSLFVIFSFQNLFEILSKRFWLKYFLLAALIVFILIPTILPPLAIFSKTRFGENKLIPKKQQSTKGIEWIKNNLPYDNRVAVLDIRAPHPSGMARALVEAGVFAPIFPGEVRAYTIEASPEYIDIAYFLNSDALRKLKISILLVDTHFYKTLPNLRKDQLENSSYFRKIFDNSNLTEDWEKIYEISEKYLREGGEIEEGFKKLTEILPKLGKIYIDNEENFNPSYLRRAVIFSLREHDLYFLPQSGVYLNVEAYINQKYPEKGITYDYLVLGPRRDPKIICNCEAEIIFRGLKDSIYVWKSEYLGSFEK